jgi:hypothetical protein
MAVILTAVAVVQHRQELMAMVKVLQQQVRAAMVHLRILLGALQLAPVKM